ARAGLCLAQGRSRVDSPSESGQRLRAAETGQDRGEESRLMEAQHTFERVQNLCPDAIAAPLSSENTKDPFFKIKPDRWLEVARVLKNTPDLGFDFCNNITAVDWIKQNILQVVYHLWSYRHRHGIVIKIDLDRQKPQVPSVESVWKAANW